MQYYEALEGKEIFIEGYISSLLKNKNGISTIYLVNEYADILGYEADVNNKSLNPLDSILDIVAVEDTGQSIELSLNQQKYTQLILRPGDKVTVSCIIETLHGKKDGVAYSKPSFSLLGIEVIK